MSEPRENADRGQEDEGRWQRWRKALAGRRRRVIAGVTLGLTTLAAPVVANRMQARCPDSGAVAAAMPAAARPARLVATSPVTTALGICPVMRSLKMDGRAAAPQTVAALEKVPARSGIGDARADAIANLGWDSALVLLYLAGGAALLLLVAFAYELGAMQLLGLLTVLALALAGTLDLLENFGLWRMLRGAADSLWPAIVRALATAKVTLLAFVGLYLVVALASWLWSLRKRDRGYPKQVTRADEGRAVPVPQEELVGAVDGAAALDDVIAHERQYLRHHRGGVRHFGEERGDVDTSLVGLAMSGGGIRSATTNLGILQGLAQLRVLPMVDYLCTVSGGGYIGSCLSTLLSLNASRIPACPPATEKPERAHLFGPGDTPAFDTTWEKFPFRDDRSGQMGRLPFDIVAHLRTHGNFLIARRGPFGRDTMRAVGNILSGVVYNLVGFVAVLFVIVSFYLALAASLSPGLDVALGARADSTSMVAPDSVLARLRRADTAASIVSYRPPALGPHDERRTERREAACIAGTAGCVQRADATVREPTPGEWIARNLRQLAAPVIDAVRGAERGQSGLLLALVGALVWGALATLVALAIMGFGLLALKLTTIVPTPGESEEEVSDRGVLRLMAALALALAVGAAWAWRDGVVLPRAYRLIGLWIPFLTLLGARVMSIAVLVVMPRLRIGKTPFWTRRFRSMWGAYQSITIYGLWFTAIFTLFAPIAFALSASGFAVTVSALVSLATTRLLTESKATGGKKWKLPLALRHLLLTVAVVVVAVLTALAVAAALLQVTQSATGLWIASGVSLLVFILVGLVVDHNKLSPHYFYRDRLAETYLNSELPDTRRSMWSYRDAMELPLHRLHGDAAGAVDFRNPAPYQLISAAINLAGSRDLTRKDRKSGYWLFSKLYCGSVHTGFRPTAVYRAGETKIARALAISGAAAASGMGFHSFFAQAFATVLFNIRLGYWLENPALDRSARRKEGWTFWPLYLAREVMMRTTERSTLVNLSDGGHTGDNVGIYPLLQRRCKVIIACDAEQDRTLAFTSFTEALRHAYIDEGISVDIDLSMIRPDRETGYSRSHCAVGRILYPDRPWQESYLVYLKNSITGDEPEPVLNYRELCPDFPHESTIDQFFDDAQFESYRALGVHIAKSTFAHWAASVMPPAPPPPAAAPMHAPVVMPPGAKGFEALTQDTVLESRGDQ